MGRGLLPVPLCALLRHAGVGSRERVQPPLPPARRRPFSGGGGRPPGPGGRRAAPVAPLLGWVRGGGGGAPPRPLSGLCGRGGGEWGGAFGPLATPPDGRGGGAAWQSWPRGPAISWGVAPFLRPPLPRAGSSCRPSLRPLIPPARGRAALAGRGWP